MLASALSRTPAPEIRYSHPASAGVLVWRRGAGSYVLTAIVKVTFDLVSGGTATVARRQFELSNEVPGDLGDDRATMATDWVPYKPYCDVSVIGIARPRPGDVAPGAEVEIRVDDLVKRLRVPSRQLVEEFAPLSSARRAATSPPQRATLAWSSALRTSCQPPPADVDFSVFNAAPADLQVQRIGDEPHILLEGLTPGRSRVASRLPRLTVSATVRDAAGDGRINLRCDTLWIDASSGTATLTWRGVYDLAGNIGDARFVAFEVRQEAGADAPPASSRTRLLALPSRDRANTSLPSSSPPPSHSSGVWAIEDQVTRLLDESELRRVDPLPFLERVPIVPQRCVDQPCPIEDGDTLVLECDAAGGSAAALPFVAKQPIDASTDGDGVMALGAFARLAARLDLFPGARQKLLREAALDETGYQQQLAHWSEEMQEEARLGCTDSMLLYDEHYLAAIEAERGTVSLDDFALLSVAAERAAEEQTAATLGIPERAMLSVERVWNRRLLADPSLRQPFQRKLKSARAS